MYALSVLSRQRSRIWIDGKLVLEQVSPFIMYPGLRTRPMPLKAGQSYSVRVECECVAKNAQFGWYKIAEPIPEPGILSGRFCTGSLFPLITGAPDKERAERMLQAVRDENRFGGEFVVPSVIRTDPAFPGQYYWRGRIWAPYNYLLWLGLQRYADQDLLADYAKKNEDLFMRNWNESRRCYENYECNGSGASAPYYTWGALLPLIHYEHQQQKQAE